MFSSARYGDPYLLRAEHALTFVRNTDIPHILTPLAGGVAPALVPHGTPPGTAWTACKDIIRGHLAEVAQYLLKALEDPAEREVALRGGDLYESLIRLRAQIHDATLDQVPIIEATARSVIGLFASRLLGTADIRSEAVITDLRSQAMNGAAVDEASRFKGKTGLWKVGNHHIPEMRRVKGLDANYVIMSKADFNADFLRWRLARLGR